MSIRLTNFDWLNDYALCFLSFSVQCCSSRLFWWLYFAIEERIDISPLQKQGCHGMGSSSFLGIIRTAMGAIHINF